MLISMVVIFGTKGFPKSAEAIGYFEQALREDPSFALAYSGLADCYSVNWAGGWDLCRAEEYARKALALQPDLVQGHVSLALAETGDQAQHESFRFRRLTLEFSHSAARS